MDTKKLQKAEYLKEYRRIHLEKCKYIKDLELPYEDLPNSVAEALEVGSMYYKSKSCRRGHVDVRRYTRWGHCLSCCREDGAKKRSTEEYKIYQKEYDKREGVKDRRKQSEIRYRAKPEAKELKKKYSKEYRQRTKDNINAKTIWRRLSQSQRTPKWAKYEEIKKFYKESHRLTKETGIQHHVDHIIPLNGEKVSGLHVENNLRVIPFYENIAKKNTFIEELL